MKGIAIRVLLACLLVAGFAGKSLSADYEHEISDRGITFSWKLDGDTLHGKVKAKTTGWVGVGFNPQDQMKGANFVLGYVEDGKVVIEDDYGHEERNHKVDKELGGEGNVTVVGGEEKSGSTTIEFTIPLNSGDQYDSVLDPEGETVVLLAYGGRRDSFRSKHKYKTSVKVNLSTGKTL